MKLPETMPELQKMYEDLKPHDLNDFKKTLNERYHLKFMPFYEEHPDLLDDVEYDNSDHLPNIGTLEFMKYVINGDKVYHNKMAHIWHAPLLFILDVIQSDFEKYINLDIGKMMAEHNFHLINIYPKEYRFLIVKIKCEHNYFYDYIEHPEEILDYVLENYPEKFSQFSKRTLEVLKKDREYLLCKIDMVSYHLSKYIENLNRYDVRLLKYENPQK